MNLRSVARNVASKTMFGLQIGLASIALFQFTIGTGFANDKTAAKQASTEANFPRDAQTTSPIKHVIVIIGENRSFDHVFATYAPKNGQTVNNLLSEGIVKLDANLNAIPGPNYSRSQQ